MPDIERLLIEDARAWRAGLDSAPASGTAAVQLASGEPHWRWTTGLAAAVVLAVMTLIGTGVYSTTRGRSHPAGPAAINVVQAMRDPLTPNVDWRERAALPAKIVPVPSAGDSASSSMPWKFQSLSADGRVLTIVYAAGDGSCTTPVGIAVEQTSTYVALEPISWTDRTQQACPSVFVPGRAVITLDTPLGTRALLHPQVDQKWKNVSGSL